MFFFIMNYQKKKWYKCNASQAAYCPVSQLVPIFQLLLNVTPQLAAVFKSFKTGASFENDLS